MNFLSFLMLMLFIFVFHFHKSELIWRLPFCVGGCIIAMLMICYTSLPLYWLMLLIIFIMSAIELKTDKTTLAILLMRLPLLLLISILACHFKLYEWMSWLLSVQYVSDHLIHEQLICRYEASSTGYQNRLLKNQVDEVQNIYMTMRGWRHDYHNHLQSLKVKLNQHQIEEAAAYLNELEQDLSDIHMLVESGNVNIDAILNSKLSLAVSRNIEINVKVSIPQHLPLRDIDCCVLLGNLIDNAIEACELLSEHKFIRLYIGLYKKQLYISVTNATNEIIRKLDEDYITSKRGNHGHGLKRINRVVEKYGGYINRKNEPGVFVTEILLPMSEPFMHEK